MGSHADFDFTIILFSGIIAIILCYVPNAVSAISGQVERQKDTVIQAIIQAGIYQNLSFYSVFIIVVIFGFYFWTALD